MEESDYGLIQIIIPTAFLEHGKIYANTSSGYLIWTGRSQTNVMIATTCVSLLGPFALFFFSASWWGNNPRNTNNYTTLHFIRIISYTATKRLGANILPPSGIWHQNIFTRKTCNSKVDHNKHIFCVNQ